MELGIFAKTFLQPDLDGILSAVVDQGLVCVQFSMECVGLPPLPDYVEPGVLRAIRETMAARQVAMASLSGTYNMIHPDRSRRRLGLARLEVLAAACSQLGTRVITLCTGTRDPENMWRRHPDNDTDAAWSDLVEAMSAAVQMAERHNVILGIEPEVSNVVDSARKARRLLDAMDTPHLKVVMDGANLFHAGELARMHTILDEAFHLLGDDIVLAHAKDLTHDGEAGNVAAGQGLLDYSHYLALLESVGFDGPLILHSLEESQVPAAVAYVRGYLHPGFA